MRVYLITPIMDQAAFPNLNGGLQVHRVQFLVVNKHKATLLLIEDDPGIRESLQLGLELDGYQVLTAATGSDGLRLLRKTHINLLILDVLLPGSDGYSVLNEVRSAPDLPNDLPVLMLTALDEIEDRVQGLRSGADDYLIKPYAHAELVARIEVLLRRTHHEEPRLQWNDLSLDLMRLEAWRAGEKLQLSPKDFHLLRLFVEHAERILSKEALMIGVWGEEIEPNTLEVHLSSLRRALGGPPLIRTVRGYGYIMKRDG